METKIHYALFELNGNVVFTIFDMDERFRWKTKKTIHDPEYFFAASNGWKIESVTQPQIVPRKKTIYLRGVSRDNDKKIAVLPEDSHVKCSEIHEALQDWAKNWEGWKEGEEPVRQETITVPIYGV